MNEPTTTADPVRGYLTALEQRLRGPAAVRRSLLAEARDGLEDAAAAYREGGLAAHPAAALAVRDFGPVPEIAPHFQEELTARQGRRTALLTAVAFPAMLLGWGLLWSSGVSWKPGPVSALVPVLATVQDVATVVVAVTAVALLALTFRRAAPPRRVTAAVGVTAAAGALMCGLISVAMNLVDLRATAGMIATNPLALPALAVSGAVMVLLICSGVRSLRVARAR